MQGREGVPLRLLLLMLLLALAGLGRCRGRGRSRLALWIDREQVELLIGMPMKISIIRDGLVTPYIKEPGLSEAILIPPEVDTVNLTWQAGHDKFNYKFNFTSLDPRLLYRPLLGIPESGHIPSAPTVFQITIPCKGDEEGVASLVLRLSICQDKRPLKGTPIQFTLKKQCLAFVTTSLCSGECQNGGTCSQFGQCECRQGFQGEYCEIALCDPVCKNNGTCISPAVCACPQGYTGRLCETSEYPCERPCENGGHCLPEGFCWCKTGFYGDSCELRIVSCTPQCANGGTCKDMNRCQCPSNFSGPRCETKEERPRRSKTDSKEQQRRDRTRRTRNRRHKLEKKVEKAERRLLKVMFKDGKSWQLAREERRVLRRLQREKHTGLLPRKDRKFLVQILTRERGYLKKKYKKSLRRYKKLLKKMRKMRKKPRKKKKKFV